MPYKDGLGEVVMFLLHKDNQILTEYRIEKEPHEWFIPNGGIEDEDVVRAKRTGEDYRVVAVHREMDEEFSGVKPTSMTYKGKFEVLAIKSVFYIYLVDKWDGDIPEYNYEEGKLAAELHWMDIEKARSLFTWPVLQHALSLLPDQKTP